MYAEEIQELLQPLAKEVIVYTFKAGEKNKNLYTVKDLYTCLIDISLTAKIFWVALGGGCNR